MRSLLLAAVLSSSVLAQQLPVDVPAAAVRLTPEAEVAFIKNAARIEKPRVDLWRWSWVAGYTLLTLGQAVPIPFMNTPDLRDMRVDFAVGAITSAVGAILLLAAPLEIAGNAKDIEALPDDAKSLDVARALLRKDADDEAFNVSWLLHAGNVLLNGVASVLLGVIWNHWVSAAINFAAGTAIGEAMILTQPTGMIRARDELGPAAWAFAPFVVPQGGGLSFGARF